MSNGARIALARLYFALGWPGCAGLACLLMALAGQAWVHHEKALLSGLSATGLTAGEGTASTSSSPPNEQKQALIAPVLPRAADSVQIVRVVEGLAKANGLAWPQAEYKITPLSDEALAALEIRTTLRGPYPKLRQMIAQLLDKEPALAMRELSLSRQNGDAVEVEAKIRWAVFLADGWPLAAAAGQP